MIPTANCAVPAHIIVHPPAAPAFTPNKSRVLMNPEACASNSKSFQEVAACTEQSIAKWPLLPQLSVALPALKTAGPYTVCALNGL